VTVGIPSPRPPHTLALAIGLRAALENVFVNRVRSARR
jgi:hypothetical protein